MENSNLELHMHNPILTWMALAAAGLSVLWFFDILPYVGYVAMRAARVGHWKPDYDKAWKSVAANVLVWGFVALFLASTHIHLPSNRIFRVDASMLIVLLVASPLVWLLLRIFRNPLNRLSRLFLRLPLRTGLFPNYERNKYLRARIPEKPLQESVISVVFTATDLQTGAATFFTNKSREELKREPLAQAWFIDREVEPTQEMLQAMIASSAFTIAYEAVQLHGRLWSDGGIITNQPIRPAVRLGADVLFLVFTDPLESSGESTGDGEIKTFIDVGVNAISILLSKNLKTDLKMVDRVNDMCSLYAKELGVLPEQVQLEVGGQTLRYVKAIAVAPERPVPVNALDFDGNSSTPMIVQGYRDGTRAVAEFIEYEAKRPAPRSRQNIRLVAERAEGNYHSLREM
jgi:patatin-like phospholipase